jgi:hypothetical protein
MSEHQPHTTSVLLLVFGLIACSAASAEMTFKSHCQTFGTAPLELLGDREGHAIAVGHFTCRVDGGPIDGAVWTGSQVYEWDGPNAVGRGGFGVFRLSGSFAVYSSTEVKVSLNLSDGRVTGFTGSGRGMFSVGTGAASVLAGKSYTYVVKSSGFNQVVVETTVK